MPPSSNRYITHAFRFNVEPSLVYMALTEQRHIQRWWSADASAEDFVGGRLKLGRVPHDCLMVWNASSSDNRWSGNAQRLAVAVCRAMSAWELEFGFACHEMIVAVPWWKSITADGAIATRALRHGICVGQCWPGKPKIVSGNRFGTTGLLASVSRVGIKQELMRRNHEYGIRDETRDLSGTSNDFPRVASNGAPDVRTSEMSVETSDPSANRDQVMPIRALIVDDEPLARKRIYDLLRQDKEVDVIGECGSGSAAMEVLEREKPDLLFLDIQMPEVDGFELLDAIEGAVPAIIFVTAYDKYALRAFDAQAVDYLLKPFNESRFHQALHRAKEKIGKAGSGQVNAELLSLLKDVQNGRSPLIGSSLNQVVEFCSSRPRTSTMLRLPGTT